MRHAAPSRWPGGRPTALGGSLLALVGVLVAAQVALAPQGPRAVTLPPAADAGAVSSTRSSLLAGSSAVSGALPGQRNPDGMSLQAGPGTPAGDSRVMRLRSGGRERGYLLLPALGLADGAAAALLVVLHQDVGSARAVAEGLGLDRLRRHGIALAYPAGVGGSWNAGKCCGVAMDQDVDDVAFVNAVLADVGRRTAIDPRRRALLGYSGGGMLAYRVMCQSRPDLAAAVEVSGSLESACPLGVRLPDLLSVHGALDGTVGLTEPIRVTHLGMAPRPVESTLRTVTTQAGCGPRRTTDRKDDRLVRWRACGGGSSVHLQIVRDAGHGWDDLGASARAIPFLLDRLT